MKSECYFFTQANHCFLISSPKLNQSPKSVIGSFKHFQSGSMVAHGMCCFPLMQTTNPSYPTTVYSSGSLAGGHRKTKNEIQIPSSLNCIIILSHTSMPLQQLGENKTIGLTHPFTQKIASSSWHGSQFEKMA